MPEITVERLYQMIGSAKANKADAKEQARIAQLKAVETIAHYDGAVQVLEMLRDDLRAQQMSEDAQAGYGGLNTPERTAGKPEQGAAEGAPAAQNAMTLEQLQEMMPPNVSIAGVVLNEEE